MSGEWGGHLGDLSFLGGGGQTSSFFSSSVLSPARGLCRLGFGVAGAKQSKPSPLLESNLKQLLCFLYSMNTNMSAAH